jgi:alkanesulfonate monooxygenase SsuD/methylene tetrahydromethanopterin reductase-like flavin-dependent oxidoreductase (luciferase family)
MGPRTVRSAAAWADGLAGFTLDLDVAAISALYDVARDAWADAGRHRPLLTTSFWVSLAPSPAAVPEARAQVHRHLRHYLNWLPPGLVDAMSPTTGFAGTATELRDLLRRLEDIGTDEVHLIPTSSDVGFVERVAELAGTSP